jgi:[CysO sulfur-carrier protein]-S-L-cysteine hydrolase
MKEEVEQQARRIEIPRELYEQIVSHALKGYPNEACGAVAGTDGKAVRVYPMRNAEESPVVYRFDEREQLRVFDEIEGRGWEILAFFHSHTHTEAYPSPTDLAQAHWRDPLTGDQVAAYPGTRYLILSLRDDEPVLRGFRFDGGAPVEEEVRIT